MQPKSITPRAAIYCRVSSKGQEDNASLPTQRAACETYAAEQGYQVVDVYQDVHSGAELFERPALTRLRAAIRAGQIDVLIVYAVDRLSRNQAHVGLLLTETDHHSVSVEIVTEPLESTATGRFLLSAKTFAAEIEREKIRERSLRGKLARVQSGKLPNYGADFYGYRRDKAAGVRAIEPTEAAIVAQIYDWYVNDHLGMLAIAKRLNATGTPPPSAGKMTYARMPVWSPRAIQRIVTAPEYKGETVAQKTKTTRRRHSPRPESERIRLPEGVTPAIVSADLWDAAQQQRASNRGDRARNEQRPALLRGLIRCAVCGYRMHPYTEHRDQRGGTRVYRCGSRTQATGPCGGSRVPAEAVEAWTWAQIAEILRNPQTILAEVSRRRADGPDPQVAADREATQRQIDSIDRQMGRLLALYLEGDGEIDDYRRARHSLETQRASLLAALADLDARLADDESATLDLAMLQAYCDHLGDPDALDFEDKRLALETFRVTVRASGRLARIDGAWDQSRAAGVVLPMSSPTLHNARIAFTRTRPATRAA